MRVRAIPALGSRQHTTNISPRDHTRAKCIIHAHVHAGSRFMGIVELMWERMARESMAADFHSTIHLPNHINTRAHTLVSKSPFSKETFPVTFVTICHFLAYIASIHASFSTRAESKWYKWSYVESVTHAP